MADAVESKAETETQKMKKLGVILGAAAVLITAGVVALCFDWKSLTSNEWQKTVAAVAFGLWTVVPPVWFLSEWHRFRPTKEYGFDDFKYSQELAKNVWIAVAVVLGLLFKFKTG